MPLGDFLNHINQLLPAAEHGGNPVAAHETLQERRTEVAWAFNDVLQVIMPIIPEAPKPLAAPEITQRHVEAARSLIDPHRHETAAAQEDKRIDDLVADIYTIHDEHALKIAAELEAEKQRRRSDFELAA